MSTDLENVETAMSLKEDYTAEEFIADLREIAESSGDSPEPMAAGTFAMYATPDGGMMMVTSVAEGNPMAGVRRTKVPPGMIRAVTVLAGGGSIGSAIRAAAIGGRRGRKAIEGGHRG